jgi:hypothetical protein
VSQVRGKPFQPGNSFGRGRPKRSQNKGTLLAQQLLEDHAELIVRKLLVEAAKGDRSALRLTVERILPPCRDRSIQLPRLPIGTAADLDISNQRVVHAVTDGKITPSEGETVANILEGRRRILETRDLESRLQALEQSAPRDGRRAA